jgi:hypothetical protein
LRLVEASPAHIPYLAANMRAADVTECAAYGRRPASALTSALGASLWAMTAIVEGEPHAMMGVAPLNMMAGVGVPWMLGTERVYDHARDLIRYSPAILGEMHATFSVLENYVSTSNARAIRFLRHVGFEFCEGVSKVGGTAFVRFRKGAI